jgi:hypothetical protein
MLYISAGTEVQNGVVRIGDVKGSNKTANERYAIPGKEAFYYNQ